MTDIRDYPNPLLKQFSDFYNLGLQYDTNGVPHFNGTKVSLAQFEQGGVNLKRNTRLQ